MFFETTNFQSLGFTQCTPTLSLLHTFTARHITVIIDKAATAVEFYSLPINIKSKANQVFYRKLTVIE